MQLATVISNSYEYHLIEKPQTNSREGIYRLWYDVYCVEMNRNLDYADHENKTITDDLEPHSYIFAAKDLNNNVIGSIRINFPEDGYPAYYDDLYELNTFNPGDVGFATRYMVHSNYRGNYISHELMMEATSLLKRKGKKYLIIDCNPPVYKLFEKLGFVDYLGEKNSKEYGLVKIMKLDIAQEKGSQWELSPIHIIKEKRHEKIRGYI